MMLHLTADTKIMLALVPVDFRKQIDGLAAICRNDLQRQPKDGVMYVFVNRSKTSIKILCYRDNGYWLTMKRLSRGRFTSWPDKNKQITTLLSSQLRNILKTCSYNKKIVP